MLQERLLHERLARICHCDYDREIALLAETTNVVGEQDLMGEVRLSKLHGTNEARLSILIRDRYLGIELGSQMGRRLARVASTRILITLILSCQPTISSCCISSKDWF
jgi:acetyltransferase